MSSPPAPKPASHEPGKDGILGPQIGGTDGDKDVAVPLDARFTGLEPFSKEQGTSQDQRRALCFGLAGGDAALLRRELTGRAWEVDVASETGELLDWICSRPYEIAFVPLPLEGMDMAALIQAIRQQDLIRQHQTWVVGVREAGVVLPEGVADTLGLKAILTRPLTAELLERTLRFGVGRSVLPVERPVDLEALRSDLEGDEVLLRHLAGVLVADFPRALAAMAAAVEARDGRALQRAAHSLRGALGNFRAGPAFLLADQVERLSESGRLDEAGQALTDLERELAGLGRFLAESGLS
jgi:HPt (histidine-containing phosphotransfer) domain-containing protein